MFRTAFMALALIVAGPTLAAAESAGNRVEVDGMRMYYEVSGKGQPLVVRTDGAQGQGFLPSSKSGVVTPPADKALSLPYLSTSKSLVIDGAAGSFFSDGSERAMGAKPAEAKPAEGKPAEGKAAAGKPAEGKAPRFLFSSKSAAPIVEPPAER